MKVIKLKHYYLIRSIPPRYMLSSRWVMIKSFIQRMMIHNTPQFNWEKQQKQNPNSNRNLETGFKLRQFHSLEATHLPLVLGVLRLYLWLLAANQSCTSLFGIEVPNGYSVSGAKSRLHLMWIPPIRPEQYQAIKFWLNFRHRIDMCRENPKHKTEFREVEIKDFIENVFNWKKK